jgi:hypothetical protein
VRRLQMLPKSEPSAARRQRKLIDKTNFFQLS